MAKKTAKSPSFAKLLRELYERRWPGSTLREQAERLGVTASTLSRLYNLTISPAPETVYHLARVLQADPALLFAALDGREIKPEEALFATDWWDLSSYRSPAFKLLTCYVAEILFASFTLDLHHPFFALIRAASVSALGFLDETDVELTMADLSLSTLGTERETLVRSAVSDALFPYLRPRAVSSVNGSISEKEGEFDWKKLYKEKPELALRLAAEFINHELRHLFGFRAFLHACLYHVSPRQYLQSVPPHVWRPFADPFNRHHVEICVDTELKRIEKRLLPFASSELERLYPTWRSDVEQIISRLLEEERRGK